jgi:hypothetical protein
LSLLVLEQAYRTYLFGGASFSIDRMNSIHYLGISGLIKPSNISEIIYELKPNLDTYFKLAKFKTNSNGLRDKDYSLSKSRGIFRVALIGDSYVMASGVEIEESFHSILEEKLNKVQRDRTYQFINFGVGGCNLRQYLGIIRFKATEYEPDLIIVGFCAINDHEIHSNRIFEQPYKVKPATYPFFKSFVLEKLIHITKSKRKIKNAVVFTEERKKYISHIFSEMKAYSKQSNIPIIIIHLSIQYNKVYANELEALVVDNGLNFADVSLPFAGKNFREYMIYPTDGHPNGKANRIFADELYGYLNSILGNEEMFLYEKKNN